MRRWAWNFLIFILFLLAAGSFYQGIQRSLVLKQTEQYVDILLKEGVTPERASAILKEEEKQEQSFSLVFWGKTKDKKVTWEELGRSMSAEVLEVMGAIEHLMQESSYLDLGESNICFPSVDVAEELFHGTQVQGNFIKAGTKEYEIRKVAEYIEDTLFVSADKKDQESTLNRIRVKKSPGKTARETVDLLSQRYGLSCEYVDYSLIFGLACGILWLFPLFISGGLLAGVVREMGRGKHIIFILGWIWIGYLWFSLCQIPEELIPTKWSDFTFWESCAETIKNAVFILMGSDKAKMEVTYIELFFEISVRGILSVGLYFLAIICYTIRRIIGKEQVKI